MADTAKKRKSVPSIARPFRPKVVDTDGTVDAQDRTAIGWNYAGAEYTGGGPGPFPKNKLIIIT